MTFDTDPLGAPAPTFDALVGNWYVADAAGVRGFKVDPREWRKGKVSPHIDEQSKRLWAGRHRDFSRGVKASALFPFAVWKSFPPPDDFGMSVRFYLDSGKSDPAAGLVFGIGPDGSYQGLQLTAHENTLRYFRVALGKQLVIDTVREIPLEIQAWHALSIEFRGNTIHVEVDGQKRWESHLDAGRAGRVGLWAKADCQAVFDDFRVALLPPAAP